MFDERLTSVISKIVFKLRLIYLVKRERKKDSIAAQIILQDYLNKEKKNNG